MTTKLIISDESRFAVLLTKDWGSFKENTTEWDGMVGHLVRQEADIAVSFLVEDPSRRSVVDYTFTTLTSHYSAFFLRPTFRADRYGLLKPFGPSTWLLVVIISVLATSLVLLTHVPSGGADSGISWGLMYAIGLLSWESPDLPHSTKNALKMATLTGSAVGLLLFTMYAGKVLSFLSVAKNSMNSMEQLFLTSYTIGVDNNFFPLHRALQVMLQPLAMESKINLIFFIGPPKFSRAISICPPRKPGSVLWTGRRKGCSASWLVWIHCSGF